LVTVVGVKYTTARDVAAKTIDLIIKKLGHRPPPCRTDSIPIHGGAITRFDDFVAQEMNRRAHNLSPEIIKPLIHNYGVAYHEVLKCCDPDSAVAQTVTEDSEVLKAEVLYGIREEMAQKLVDVIRRRTELGSAGYPGDEAVHGCAAIMAKERGWNAARVQSEIEEARAVYRAED
jgi:glycerol-3-phosphate dehydrogenase